jgi:hypothetical protein
VCVAEVDVIVPGQEQSDLTRLGNREPVAPSRFTCLTVSRFAAGRQKSQKQADQEKTAHPSSLTADDGPSNRYSMPSGNGTARVEWASDQPDVL